MSVSFDRLVRFEDADGQRHYGEAGMDWEAKLLGREIETFSGAGPCDEEFRLSGRKAIVAKVLCPLETTPIIIGVGLNYRKHIEEAGDPVPDHPVLFTKYPDSLAGPNDEISIHPEIRELDYEGELSFVLSRDVKNISEQDDPSDYILGFTVGHDLSSRYWSALHPERSGGQHGYAKAFDKFAPIGPVITSCRAIGNPEGLRLRTWVNDELRQDANTDDLIFGVRALMRHISRGTTLRKGTLVMTGTPSGVGFSFRPPKWLKDGDVVAIEIEKIGKIQNKMQYEI